MIEKEFFDWVLGIEEEDPLPLEIKNVCFVLNKKNGINELMYLGSEGDEENLTNFSYFPLEAQFFFCHDFLKLPNIKNEVLCLVKNFLSSSCSSFLIGKKIKIGYFQEKPFFCCYFNGKL